MGFSGAEIKNRKKQKVKEEILKKLRKQIQLEKEIQVKEEAKQREEKAQKFKEEVHQQEEPIQEIAKEKERLKKDKSTEKALSDRQTYLEQLEQYENGVILVPPKPPHKVLNEIWLDCPGCGYKKTMMHTEINRFDGFLFIIGIILLIPAGLGIFAGFVIMMMGFLGSGLPFGILVICSSLVSGTFGFLLLSKQKVYCCSYCRHIIPRA